MSTPRSVPSSAPSARPQPLFRLPGVYRPDADSRLLAAHVRGEPLAGRHVLDLCTGSGFVAQTAALEGAGSVTAVDASLAAAVSARVNLLRRRRARAVRGDLFAAVGSRRFDVVTANPPYVPLVGPRRLRSRAWDAGGDGRETIDRICARASAHLVPGGVLLMVHSEIARPRLTVERLRDEGLDADVVATRRIELGPVMTERREALLELGLMSEPDSEQIAVIRAVRPVPA